MCDGNSINVWKDPWIQNFKPTPIVPEEDQEPILVSNLIHPITCRWKVDLLVNMFEDAFVEAILKVNIPQFPKSAELVWIKEAKGNFTVKSAYRISQEGKLSLN